MRKSSWYYHFCEFISISKCLQGAKERILSAMGQSSEPEKASSSDNNLKSHKDLSNNNQSDEGRYLKNSNQPEPW